MTHDEPICCCFLNCKEIPNKSIIYDCGPNPNQELVICNKHYESNEVFRQFIKKIEEI